MPISTNIESDGEKPAEPERPQLLIGSTAIVDIGWTGGGMEAYISLFLFTF
jgi:hypothetical protein